jgi:hypothetical protein
LALAVLLAFVPASAENLGPGGGTRIVIGDQVVGPYRLLVTVSPEPAQVGTVTFVIRVTDPSSGSRVEDADIMVTLLNGDTGARVESRATHASAGNPLDYAAHLVMDQPGSWSGTVRVSSPAGSADVTFVQRVLAPRRTSTLVLMALPFLLVLGGLGGLWLARSARRRPAM